MGKCDVAILGAGPYGLSAAAHLCCLRGLDLRVFGEPMAFWERHMPIGMLLLSRSAASNIADPANRLTWDGYRQLNGKTNGHYQVQDPLPVADFIKYGHWFHQESGASAERRKVVWIEAVSGGYELVLEDGELIRTNRVVVAAGVQRFAYRPKRFEGLPSSLVTHTSEHTDYAKFRGKKVIVVGGGRSAVEAAAYLEESGAHAEVLIREPAPPQPHPILFWLKNKSWRNMLYGRGDVGPAGISLIVQRPNLFRRLPRRMQDAWDRRSIRPTFSSHYLHTSRTAPVRLSSWIVRTRAEGCRLRVSLNDGSERTADHVILGTGYRVNVAAYDFLSPRILEKLNVVDGYPRLDAGFESTLAGLHFLGAPAAWSFGPLLRFVAGTEFTSRALTLRIQRRGKG